jgi:hypothetical protein
MGYEFDTSAWPVVHIRFVGRLTSEESAQYFRDSDALVQGGRRYATVMDGRTMLTPEVDFVRRQAQWITDHIGAMQRLNCGIAFVAESALVRGLVRAVIHFQPMPVENRVFSEIGAASRWALAQVQARSGTSQRPPGPK